MELPHTTPTARPVGLVCAVLEPPAVLLARRTGGDGVALHRLPPHLEVARHLVGHELDDAHLVLVDADGLDAVPREVGDQVRQPRARLHGHDGADAALDAVTTQKSKRLPNRPARTTHSKPGPR
mmetsp:Transcript_10661/g.32739  ORF Transcript_10661/g.32739 Transcript_10661/m.32739 type:complete len:124 (+) Transcript_10661:40-411(+)|eukprot:scaffold269401_cov31-Tisochrysis_lutea.AAC.4